MIVKFVIKGYVSFYLNYFDKALLYGTAQFLDFFWFNSTWYIYYSQLQVLTF